MHPWPLLAAAAAAFAAPAPVPPPSRAWDEYVVILWTGDTVHKHPDRFPLYVQRLRELGATAGMVHGRGDPAPWRAAGVPYYVENVVNRGLCLKWNSKVRDWDRFINDWSASRDPAAFVREYGLLDPAWREWARREAAEAARRNAPHAPLAYNLRDELSITFSANPFDYDFSPPTLEEFRRRLRRRHGDLAALNRAWATEFPSWKAVRPFSTDEIKHRMAGGGAHPSGTPHWRAVAAIRFDPAEARRAPDRWNLAPWCEFHSFLDDVWAEILDDLRRTIRAADSAAPIGIEGTQMPHAFGGFDLWKLACVVDWIEPYDIGGARAIFGSFMEGRPILSTLGVSDACVALRRLWHLLLEGDRGCIVWWSEDCIDWSTPDWRLTAKGRALEPALREMRGPLARLLLRAHREWDPIAIHYSQPSIQVAWLLESTVDGRTWPRRFSSHESKVNRQAAQRVAWLRALRRAGYWPRFVSQRQIEEGALRSEAWTALILPSSWAMSEAEVAAVRAFAATGGRLIYEGEPGVFDDLGRLRPKAALEPRPAPADPAAEVQAVRPPAVRIEPSDRGVIPHRLALGRYRLLALQMDTSGGMGEDLEVREEGPALDSVEVEAILPGPRWIASLDDGQRLGRSDRIRVTVPRDRPRLLVLSETPFPDGDLTTHLASLPP